jgi:hypothetical protein
MSDKIEISISDILEKEEMQELLQERTRNAIVEATSYVIQARIRERVESLIERDIDEVVKQTLSGAVLTDDGWGKKEQYESFETLYKKRLKEELNGYCITSKADAIVKDAVKVLVGKHVTRLAASLEELAVDGDAAKS